ncbi:hypothetical protein CDAR_226121 [Caerostris darwini]|uniref:Uncharacterized protein n=1 Tax=Caerostris darwini TaxID=1538125 RepID=A0AAV4ULF6_9ARAC|nr:hypothetical protein CDAR_226121 [Caerostris darwini]
MVTFKKSFHSNSFNNLVFGFISEKLKTSSLTMVASKKLFAFFVVLVLGLLVPGPSMSGVEAMHMGGGGGGGMRGVEALLAAGILAKLLRHHHHESHHHHHGHHGHHHHG